MVVKNAIDYFGRIGKKSITSVRNSSIDVFS